MPNSELKRKVEDVIAALNISNVSFSAFELDFVRNLKASYEFGGITMLDDLSSKQIKIINDIWDGL